MEIEINVGDIFTEDEHYSERAEWCNKNGCFIEEIEPNEDGERQFRIKEVPAPTDEELAKNIRAKRDSLISETDYLMLSDYPITEEQREELVIYRQALRDVTLQDGFPKEVTFPEKPSFLIK